MNLALGIPVRSHRALFRAAALLAAVSLGGCAGGTLQRFTGENIDLSRDLPEEFRNRFEIKEVEGTRAATAPAHGAAAKDVEAPLRPSMPSPEPVPAARLPAPSAIPSFRQPPSGLAEVSAPAPRKRKVAFPDRRPRIEPIWLGEKHHFRISFLGVKVGECWMEVMPFKEVNDRKAYHVKGHAISVNPFRMIYRIDNDMETLFDYRSIVSHRFRLLLDETKQTRDAVELNDHERGQGFYWNRLNLVDKGYSEKKKFADIPSGTQDTLSQLFYLRTIPLRDGDTFSFPLATEGKVAETTVAVVGREEIDTIFGRMKAVKIRPVVRFHGILKPAGDSHIWLSDDDRRIVLRIEARVKIGAVYADLMAFERGLVPGPGQGRDDEPVAAIEKMAMPARPPAKTPSASGSGLNPASTGPATSTTAPRRSVGPGGSLR